MPDHNLKTCPICDRDMLLGSSSVNEHHWIPKTFGGKIADFLHKICHNKIHSVFTERELLNYYNTPETIKSHPEIIKFINWVRKKPVDFYDSHKDTKDRKSKRKR